VSNFGATGYRLGTSTDTNADADLRDAGDFNSGLGAATTVDYAAGTNSLDLQNSPSNGFALVANIAGTAVTDVLAITVGTTTSGLILGTTAGAADTAGWGSGAITINGAETVNLTSQGGANTFGAGGFTLTDTAATQTLTITGDQNITFTGAVRADVINASALTGTLTLTGGTGTTATTITGSAQADVLNGSTAADIISGGAGADSLMNTLDGAAVTAADVLTGGAGFDTFTLIGSAAVAANYAGVSNITDFTVGTTAANTDFIRLSATNASYSAGLSIEGTAAGATGTVGVQGVAQNVSAAAATGMEFLKLTTGVAAAASNQLTFDAAIGTAAIVTTAAGVYAGSFYDTTNSKMVVFEVASANVTIAAADVIRVIGTIDMTAADYANIDTDNFASFL